LTIKLNFQNPSIVSSFAEPDRVQIQFAGNFYFFDENGLTLQSWKTVSAAIPPLKTGADTTISAETTATLSSATNGLMVGNFVMNLVLSASL
jgi:hypothetical protein